jgi:hypothetical protein
MVKKSHEELAAETKVSVTGFDGVTVEVGTLDDFEKKVESFAKEMEAMETVAVDEEISKIKSEPAKVSAIELRDTKQFRRVVKCYGEEVAEAIVMQETESQLKMGIGQCQAKIFKATDEMEANVEYQSACEIKTDFDGALRDATKGEKAAIALRRIKLAMMKK